MVTGILTISECESYYRDANMRNGEKSQRFGTVLEAKNNEMCLLRLIFLFDVGCSHNAQASL